MPRQRSGCTPNPRCAPRVHLSAVVLGEVDPSCAIGPNAVVEAGARVGAGTVIGLGSVIGTADQQPRTGMPHRRQRHDLPRMCDRRACAHPFRGGDRRRRLRLRLGRWGRALGEDPQLGRVVIGDDVEIRANTSIDRGALEDTVIEEGVILDNQI